jgi:hypothetical protein
MKIQTIRRQMWRNRRIRFGRLKINFEFSLNFLRANKDKRHQLWDIMEQHTEYKGEWRLISNGKFIWGFTVKEIYKFNGYKEIKKTYNRLTKAGIPVKLNAKPPY